MDDADKLRSAARRGSDPSWKQNDPQVPQSIWYLTDAYFVGLRVVRPLTPPTGDEVAKYDVDAVEKKELEQHRISKQLSGR
jgi:hypothetical protein